MPYIEAERRKRFDKNLIEVHPETFGDLNYCLTMLCANYIENYGTTYHNINAVVGALECAKMELYRRLAVPYEKTKIHQNGDIQLYYEHLPT